MKMRFLNLVFLIIVAACIEPYYPVVEFRPMIVVQGMITDQPGPYIISLSRTIPTEKQSEVSARVPGATIKITDSNGYSEYLIEKSPGNFYTQNIQGAVGTSYFITVTTSDSSVYESTVEKMLPVNDFSLQSEFVMNEDSLDQRIDSVTQQGASIPSANGFNVFVKTEFLPEQEGRVWWRGIGTWQITTYPGSRKDINGRPDAPACAGIGKTVCTCCDCWITEYNNAPLIMNDQRITSLNNSKVWFVVANRRTLYARYHLQIEQLSLSAEVYAFWENLKIQRSNSSNLFQVPPPKTGGNIKALTTNAIPAIGYFAASSSKIHYIDFTKKDVPYQIQDLDFIKQSCLEQYRYDPHIKYITNVKPSFW